MRAGTLAGCPFFDAVFREVDCKVQWETGVVDGCAVALPDKIARVKLATVSVRQLYLLLQACTG